MNANKQIFRFIAFVREKVSAVISTVFRYIDGDGRQYVDGLGNRYVTGATSATVSVMKREAIKVNFTFIGWSKNG